MAFGQVAAHCPFYCGGLLLLFVTAFKILPCFKACLFVLYFLVDSVVVRVFLYGFKIVTAWAVPAFFITLFVWHGGFILRAAFARHYNSGYILNKRFLIFCRALLSHSNQYFAGGSKPFHYLLPLLNTAPACNRGIAASGAGRCKIRLQPAVSNSSGRRNADWLFVVIFNF